MEQTITFEISNIKNNSEKEIIEQMILETGCNIYTVNWQSKYNKYVRYDYEPFCAEEFTITILANGTQENIEYLDYIIHKRADKIEYLEKCLKKQKRTKKQKNKKYKYKRKRGEEL